jgi:hypothetical protein
MPLQGMHHFSLVDVFSQTGIELITATSMSPQPSLFSLTGTPFFSVKNTSSWYHIIRCSLSCSFLQHSTLQTVHHEGSTTEEGAHGDSSSGSGSSTLVVTTAVVLVKVLRSSLGGSRDARGEGNSTVSGSAGTGEGRGGRLGGSQIGLVLGVSAVGIEDARTKVSARPTIPSSWWIREQGRGMKIRLACR